MARRLFCLAALFCSSAVAFVVPLVSRNVLNRVRRDPLVGAVAAGGRSRGTDTAQMRYVSMNRFKVKIGCEDEFETTWRERESKLASFSGFEQFMLLKIDHGVRKDGEANPNKEGYTEFISHTVWKHEMDFTEWKSSQASKKSHGGASESASERANESASESASEGENPGFIAVAGGMSKIGDLLLEKPKPSMFDAVIIEPVPLEHQGGLWEFEEEASYFDG